MAAEFIAVRLAQAVISQVVQKLSDLLVNEAKSLSSVRDDVEYLKSELKFMNGFLKDADRRQKQEGLLRDWIVEVRDVACEIEDAIEIYVSDVDSAFIKVFCRRELRARISSIKNKLQSLSERRQTYQIELNNAEEGKSSLRNLRKSYPEEEEDVVSMKDVVMTLKAQLLKEEDQLRVVSIVGMGGLGKTTLAKKVYNDVGVKRHFDISAWVCISQQYFVKEVLIEINLQVGFERKNLGGDKSKHPHTKKEFLTEKSNERELLKRFEEQELIGLIEDELKEKKYLLVLDDIWNIEAWCSIKKAFPKGRRGSKVLFTTRNTELATSVDPFSSSIEPPLLTEEEGWELLQRKAFSAQVFGDNSFRSEFEELGKEMAKKCRGLPLAVVVLGGLLSTKTALGEWKKLHKDVNFQLNKLKSPQQYAVEEILDLSYQELPFLLKPCFLYLSCFPEDSEISKKKLVRLWIAEGFIPRLTTGEIMEEVAEDYFGELINRSMVQVARRDHTGGAVKTCRLHDLMRDFCISKSRNENFIETSIVTAGSSLVQCSSTTHSRRVVFHFDAGLGSHAPWMEKVHTNLRSLVCFGINIFPNLSLKNRNLKLLRVWELFFDRYRDVKVPKEIGNLIHLRYLKFSGAVISKLPNSVGNLRYLHTLDIRSCYSNSIIRVSGNAISKLVHLRHLLLPYVRGPLRIEKLSNLETLKTVDAENLIRYDAVVNLPNLRDLEVRFKSAKEASLVLQSLASQCARLRSLKLILNDEFPSLDVLVDCSALYKMHLVGRLSLQHSSFLPKSLVKLELRRSLLNQDVVVVLEKMENLRILQYSYDGYNYHSGLSSGAIMSKMVFSSHGFPKLEILRLIALDDLEEWEVGEDAMANLKRLDISRIPKLKMIPDGLKYVTTLQELNIIYMSRKFEGRLRVIDGVEGKDFHKVQHIPSISFSNTRENDE
ncbi:hypothetical protein UlMin_026020 [Ulmus minor]